MKKHFLSFILLALTLGWSANAVAEHGDYNYYVRGGMNSWGTTDKMTSQGNNQYTVTISLEAQSYGFKVSNNNWDNDCTYGKPDNGSNVVVGTAYTMKDSGSDMNISISEAGDYLFTFIKSGTANKSTILIEKAASDPCANCKKITK